MTSEVALLNKSAIALAADSATTVTYWVNNEQKTRYFKGTNKIFNISKNHPVGVMTFASANLHGVPWELVIKAYRDYLGPKSHTHLSGYASDFFEFIAGNKLIFPDELQEAQFVILADRAAASIVFPIIWSDAYKNENDPDKKQEILAQAIDFSGKRIDKDKFITGVSQEDYNSANGRMHNAVTEAFKVDRIYSTILPPYQYSILATAAISLLYKDTFTGRESTGLVFAGYGDNEFFSQTGTI